MALPANIMSQLQEMTMFEMLNIPYSMSGFFVADAIGTVRTAQTINPSALIAPDVETFITGGALSTGQTVPPMNQGVLTQLLVWINRWIAIGSNVAKQRDGSIGGQGLTNMSYDPSEEKAVLRDKIRNNLPFWPHYVYLQKLAGDSQTGSGGSGSVPFMGVA